MVQWCEHTPPTKCGSGSIPRLGVTHGLSLLLALIPAPIRGFFSGYPAFPLSSEPIISKFQFDLNWFIVNYFNMSLWLAEILHTLTSIPHAINIK